MDLGDGPDLGSSGPYGRMDGPDEGTLANQRMVHAERRLETEAPKLEGGVRGGSGSGAYRGAKVGERGPVGGRTPFDISRVKCFRCDRMGHYVRDCPDLPKRGSVPYKGEVVLNEQALDQQAVSQ